MLRPALKHMHDRIVRRASLPAKGNTWFGQPSYDAQVEHM